MKKILLPTLIATSISFAGTTDVENLLDFLSKDMTFKCNTENVCLSKNIKSTKDNMDLTIGEMKFVFLPNAFNVSFDKKVALDTIEKLCKDKSEVERLIDANNPNSGKTTDKKACLSEELNKISGTAASQVFSNLKSLDINNIYAKKEKDYLKIKNIHIDTNDKMLSLFQKKIIDIQLNDLNLKMEAKITGLEVPATTESIAKTLDAVLPSSTVISYGPNYEETVTNLKTVSTLNSKIKKMYSMIATEFIKENKVISKDLNFVAESKVINDNLELSLSFKTTGDKIVKGGTLIVFEVTNLSSSLGLVKTGFGGNQNPDMAGMALMSLAQNLNFKEVKFNTDVSYLKSISDRLKKNEKFVKITQEVENIFNSQEFKNEASKMGTFDKFIYKMLLLKNSNVEYSITNPNKVPLMLIFMAISKQQDLSKLLTIKETFK